MERRSNLLDICFSCPEVIEVSFFYHQGSVYVCACACVCACVCACACVCVLCLCVCLCACACVCACVNVCISPRSVCIWKGEEIC